MIRRRRPHATTQVVRRRPARLAPLVVAVVVASRAATGVEPVPEDDALTSYSLGHQIGMDLVRQDRRVDLEAVARGLRDGLSGAQPAYPPAELDALLLDLKRRIVADGRTGRGRNDSSLRRTGEAFLAENAGREGVVSLASGVQYRVLREGTGRQPTADGRVRVRYRSTRLDGTAFHDSLREGSDPETLRVSKLIPGLREVLPRMTAGSRYEIFVPPDLAFGRRGPLADHTLVYDLELLAVEGEADGSETGP